MTMSLISDELGQASSKKKEFLGIMEKLIPWSQWVGIVQPHYYKGEHRLIAALSFVIVRLHNSNPLRPRNQFLHDSQKLFLLR